MHITLKLETAKPPAFNFLQQQEKFDTFSKVYNFELPHQGINNKYPAQIYTPSTKVYSGIPDIEYPFADKVVTVTHCGRICMGNKKISVTPVLGGQNVGITQADDKIWLVTFMKYDIGYFDDETCRPKPINNPFRVNVLPMSPVCTHKKW